MAKTRRRVLSILMALVLTLGLLPTAALAGYSGGGHDKNRGSIEVEVEDEQGNAIPDATVKLYKYESGPFGIFGSYRYQTEKDTDSDGEYTFKGLSAGYYAVTAEKSGYLQVDESTDYEELDDDDDHEDVDLTLKKIGGSTGGNYQFQDTGSKNVEICYSVGGGDLQKMALSSTITVDGTKPIMFFVKATDGAEPVRDFTDASDNQDKIITEIDNAPNTLKNNGKGDSFGFSNAIDAATNAGYTMEWHYSQYNSDTKLRTFRFVTTQTQLTVSYEWTGDVPAGYTLPAGTTVTYGTVYSVNGTYYEGRKVVIGNATYTFSGWTAKNPAALDSQGAVVGNVVFTGTWTKEEVQTHQATFFLRADRTIKVENGQTQYSSSEYYPETTTEMVGGKLVSVHQTPMHGKVTGTAHETDSADQILKDLTEDELSAVKNKYADVAAVIVSGPTLTGTDDASQILRQTIQTNYNVTIKDGQLCMGDDPIGVLWYVCKSMAKVDDCGYHVDGVVYNTVTGKPVPLKYKLTVTHEYYTYWEDNTGTKHYSDAPVATTTVTDTSTGEKTVTVASLQALNNGGNNYTYWKALDSTGNAYTGADIAYTQSGAQITLCYERKVDPPQLYYNYTFAYYYKALGAADYELVVLTAEQQTAVTAQAGPVSERPTAEALWNSVGTSIEIPGCPDTTKAGSYAKKTAYADGEVSVTGTGDDTLYTIKVYLEQAPYTYYVQYEYMFSTNGGTPVLKGTSNPIAKTAATTPTAEAVFNAAVASDDHEVDGVTYTFKKNTTMGTNDVTDNGKTLASGERVYTVKLYAEKWTTGSLTITKAFQNLTDAQITEVAKTLTFTVTTPADVTFPEALVEKYEGSTEYMLVIPYSDLGSSGVTLSGLTPATYTITESGADLAGYTFTTTLNGDSDADSVTVVGQKEAKAAAFVNTYTGKSYTVIFDATLNGNVHNRNNTLIADGSSFRYMWFVPLVALDANTVSADPGWQGALVNGTFNNSQASQVSYTFTIDDYKEFQTDNNFPIKISQPNVTADQGYTFTGSFTTTGTDTGVKFMDLATTMAALLESGQDQITYYANYSSSSGPIDPGPIDPGPIDPGPIDPGPIDPGPSDPGTDIPDDNTPTTDLPEEETPTTELPDEETPMTEEPVEELPDEEVPMAEVPATGDTAGLWALAAGVSGLALVWLALSGKKRREENA